MYFGLKADERGQPLNTGEAICRLCRKIVLAKGGNTTNLRSHLKRRHRADFYETASCTLSGNFFENQGFDLGQEEFIEDIPALQTTPNQNYIPDAALPPGEPWLLGGPYRATLSLPSCLRLCRDSGSGGVAGSSSEEQMGEIKVYAKCQLQQGLMFGPFVGEVSKGQASLKHAWAIRDEAAFFYIDASDENKSNWMRYVTYASSEEEHNLVVFQFYRHIYYRVSQPISEGAELKVWIGRDYAALLGLGLGESTKCEVGDKEMILRLLQDIQVVTLPDSLTSSLWSDNSQSQSPMPVISDVTTMSNPDAGGDSGPVTASASTSTSSLLASFPSPAYHQVDKYDFIPGTDKLLSYPFAARNSPWFFFGFEPDPSGRPLDRSTVMCKLCGERVGCGGGSADIQSHLATKHHIRLRDSAKDRGPLTTGLRPQALSSVPTGPLPPIMTTQVTNTIANFLIRDLQPPALAEGEGFKHLIRTLLPSSKDLPSADLLESLLKDHHTKGKKRLAQLLRRKIGSGEDEDLVDYTAPIEFEPRRCGRPPGPRREVPHFVTLSVDVWFHKWQGDTERYVTLWAHYIDNNFSFHNLALTTQRLAETGAGDCSLRAVEAQVKVMAQEWGISQPSLVLLGGEGREKMRLGLTRSEKSGETAGSGPHPNSTTFLEREDSVSSDELHGQEHGHSSSEGLPSIPCFFSAVQGCIEEVMSHPVISKTLSLFQGVLSNIFLLQAQNKGSSLHHIQSLLQTVPRQERSQLKSWAHSRPSWNKLYTLLNTLVKHRSLICDVIKEVKGESIIKEDPSDPTASESSSADNSYANSASNTSPPGITAPLRYEWKVLEELCLVLKPLDVACQTLAKEAFPRLSLIKPILTGLLSRHLKPRPGDTSSILKEVKRTMRRTLASCYDNPVVNRALCVACSLDPQFHGLGFMEGKEQTAAFDWLKKEAVRIVKEDKRRSQAKKQSQRKRSPSPLSPESESDFLRRSKRLKDAAPINFRELDDADGDDDSDAGEAEESELADPGSSQAGLSGMEFLLGDLFCSAPQSRQSSVEESVDMEMSVFRADKGASLGVEPLQWWRTKAGQFPLLATVARAYLAAPAVAGSAAQDFVQEGGGATYRKRANIPPQSLDTILFLHHNHMPPATETGQTAIRSDDKT
ncbi:E3 SUMO-protein ligase ZBED1-like isoform X1 [Centroberyx affinis]|uniref:E3 SUMO-protein ligase ZBED1-like isoform X1 n=1 Tax=Centroberyx affinis TaxID=166261 RepID=UPI003A5C1143